MSGRTKGGRIGSLVSILYPQRDEGAEWSALDAVARCTRGGLPRLYVRTSPPGMQKQRAVEFILIISSTRPHPRCCHRHHPPPSPQINFDGQKKGTSSTAAAVDCRCRTQHPLLTFAVNNVIINRPPVRPPNGTRTEEKPHPSRGRAHSSGTWTLSELRVSPWPGNSRASWMT